ncbi:AbgT family transporter [Isoalcanivorax indicus]|uniref:AbgT family transporter n=1 Tax=Isoalcanivorax indicus TaxID=2202653 RepID=UPI000DBA4BCF|nr:AbgT family transporter [Isoalcanivorax indicus]
MTSPRRHGWLDRLERLGNHIPHPTLLFLWLCLLLLPLSALLSWLDAVALHPTSGEFVVVNSLLSVEGIRQMFTGAASNFTGFAPVGPVIVALLGVGIAERSGLLGAALGALVRRAPGMLLVPVIALAGVLSSVAVDAGYVVLIPLAGLMFQLAGRHPLAGIAAGFAAVAGGFSANLLIGPVDVILAGVTTEAARMVNPTALITPSANYWFLLASSLLVVSVVTGVTVRWVEPWLNRRNDVIETLPGDGDQGDRRALQHAGLALLAVVLVLTCLAWPEGGPLRSADGALLTGPLVSQSAVVIAVIAAACGITYGRSSGSLPHARAVIESMEETLRTLASYLVLMFFAAQFVAWFAWSGMGLVLAIRGADLLASMALPGPILLVLVVLLMASLNLVIGSAGAKWTLVAPVLVPMLMVLGISPEMTQAAYRVGDSGTNIITPLMPYFVLVLAFARRHVAATGVGTLITLMLPYSLALLGGWLVLLGLWVAFDWPLGF